MTPDLTDTDKATLAALLRQTIAADPLPLAPRVGQLPPRPQPFPAPRRIGEPSYVKAAGLVAGPTLFRICSGQRSYVLQYLFSSRLILAGRPRPPIPCTVALPFQLHPSRRPETSCGRFPWKFLMRYGGAMRCQCSYNPTLDRIGDIIALTDRLRGLCQSRITKP